MEEAMAVINGTEKSDTLQGTSGNDTIKGGGGDDFISGGAGADALIGGAGIDTLSYQSSSAGVWVSLDTGVAFYGDAQGDTFNGFENLMGSQHDDMLTGNTGDNVVSGGAGNDTIFGDTFFQSASGGNDLIEGGAGADMMDGGAGIDTLSYQHSSGKVWVSLQNGAASYGDAQGDSFTNFENLTGSAFDDLLVGGVGVNVIAGGAGDDLLAGDGFSPATLSSDTFVFEAGFGNDIVGDFVAGQDRLQIDHAIFANFAAVQSHMQQIGNDVVITFDASNTITLWNVQAASLHASDFVFV
jgi:Ca2+-binding RTX toxin-like protein